MRGVQIPLFGDISRCSDEHSSGSIDLNKVWRSLLERFFPDRTDLLSYTVCWSKRKQIRTLASCNLDSRKIIVAQELNNPKFHRWIEPLLFHEMCHAVLGRMQKGCNKRIPWHGREFKRLESLHPLTESLNTWISEGGWLSAVRSHRAKMAYRKRKLLKEVEGD